MGKAAVFFAGMMGALAAVAGASARVLDGRMPPGNAPTLDVHRRNICFGGVGAPNSRTGCGRIPAPKSPETISDFNAIQAASAKRERKAALRLLHAAKRTNGVAFARAPEGAHYAGFADVG